MPIKSRFADRPYAAAHAEQAANQLSDARQHLASAQDELRCARWTGAQLCARKTEQRVTQLLSKVEHELDLAGRGINRREVA